MRRFGILAVAVVGVAGLVAIPSGAASAATTTAVTPSVTSVNFGTQAVTDGTNVFGTPYTVTFTNVSGASQQLGTATLTGTDAAHFVIDGSTDTCSGKTLAASATCTVTVRPNPVAVGTVYTAALTLPVVSDSNNTASVALSATGADAPPVWAQPGPGYVLLHWSTVPTTNDATVTQYAFYKGTTPDNLQFVNTGTVGSFTSVPDKDVTPGQEYFYSVEPVENGNVVQTNPAVAAIPWDVGGAGTFVGVTSQRILDTRHGLGAPKARLSAGKVLRLKVTSAGPVPAGNVGAVVLNLTATNVSQNTAITAWPDGHPKPQASVLNPSRGKTVANLITAPLGSNGYLDITSSAGTLDLIGDVNGYYISAASNPPITTSGQYFGLEPYRVEDTRYSPDGPLPGRFVDEIPVFNFGDFSPHVNAAIVHITTLGASAAGWLSVFNGTGAPNTSSSAVNYAPGVIASNLAIVPVSPCELSGCTTGDLEIGVFNGGPAPVQVIVDVVGMYDDNTGEGGSTFSPIVPTRIVDTRIPRGLPGPIPANTNAPVDPGDLADFMTMAVDTNLTAVRPSNNTFLTVWPADFTDLTRPGTSDLNAAPGSVVPGHVIAQVGPYNRFFVYNKAGTTNVIVDADGTFELRPFPGAPGTIADLQPMSRRGVTVPAGKTTVRAPARQPLSVHPQRHQDG